MFGRIFKGIFIYCCTAPSLTAFVKNQSDVISKSAQRWFQVAAKLSFVTKGHHRRAKRQEKGLSTDEKLHGPCIWPLALFLTSGEQNLESTSGTFLPFSNSKVKQVMHPPCTVSPQGKIFTEIILKSDTTTWKRFKCYWPLFWTKHSFNQSWSKSKQGKFKGW